VESLRMLARLGAWRARLLLENTAGERGDLGARLPELGELLDRAPGAVVGGVCLDSCHAFSAGYDFRTRAGMERFAEEIERTVGRERVRVLHLNDSRRGPGSGVDRHAHLGEGGIGEEGLRRFANGAAPPGRPVILETPQKDAEDDHRNLRIARELLSSGGVREG